VKQQRLPRKGNEREEGRKEGRNERKAACMLRTRQKSDARSIQAFSAVQSSPIQFSSVQNERTNRAVAKFGREEVSNGGEEKCNSPFLVV